MPCEQNSYRISRPKAAFAWLLFAIGLAGFASIPLFIVANTGLPSSILVLLFLIVWSSLPLCFAAYLLFWSVCRIDIVGSPGVVRRRMGCALVRLQSDFNVDRAYLVRQWHYRKHGDEVRDVLYLRSGHRKRWLADELVCTDLSGLLKWIGRVAEVKCLDLRHRAPFHP